jgi:hypothetical protein
MGTWVLINATWYEAVLTHEDGLLSVAYGNLVGILIEAVKELADHSQSQALAIAKLEPQP